MKLGLGTILLLEAILLASPEVKAQNLYTLKDLEVLEREKNFEDFLKHVNDIRPSERQKLWKDMYQSMAMEMIDTFLKTGDYGLESFQLVEKVGRASSMMNDEFYQLKRSLYAKKFFTECYSKASSNAQQQGGHSFKDCDLQLNAFWNSSKKDPDVGLELAQLIEKYPSSLSSWPFYQRALLDTAAPIYCSKSFVQKAVIKKLTQETFNPQFNDDYKTLVNHLVPEACFAKLVPPLTEMTTSSLTNGLEKEMALNILEAKGKINPEDDDLLAAVYLLDGPVVGEKMNIAWSKVEKLGENFNKRKAVLEKMAALPTVPDKIFKDPQYPRYKAIINLFAKNFPEYLNYYADKCVDLMDAKKDLPPNIASGYQCSQFLKTAQELQKQGKEDWVSDKVESRYSALKK